MAPKSPAATSSSTSVQVTITIEAPVPAAESDTTEWVIVEAPQDHLEPAVRDRLAATLNSRHSVQRCRGGH